MHHVVKGAKHPAVMLTTGIKDLRDDYEGGHGGIGGGRSQAVALTADEYSFLLWQFGDPNFQQKL